MWKDSERLKKASRTASYGLNQDFNLVHLGKVKNPTTQLVPLKTWIQMLNPCYAGK
jgi:hypothetical protein